MDINITNRDSSHIITPLFHLLFYGATLARERCSHTHGGRKNILIIGTPVFFDRLSVIEKKIGEGGFDPKNLRCVCRI